MTDFDNPFIYTDTRGVVRKVETLEWPGHTEAELQAEHDAACNLMLDAFPRAS